LTAKYIASGSLMTQAELSMPLIKAAHGSVVNFRGLACACARLYCIMSLVEENK